MQARQNRSRYVTAGPSEKETTMLNITTPQHTTEAQHTASTLDVPGRFTCNTLDKRQ